MPLRSRVSILAAGFLHTTLAIFAPAASAAPWVADGVPVCVAPGGHLDPVAAADGAGGAIIAWTDRRDTVSAIYAIRLTASGAPAPGWPVNGRPVSQTSTGQYNPSIVSDGSGGAIIAWVDKRGGAVSGADLYAQRVAANGANAAGWPAAGLPICRDPLYQGPPVMCSDGGGGAYIALQNGRGGSNALVAVTRVTGAGVFAPGWSECGHALGDGTWHEADPQIARDDAGGVLVVWSDWGLGGPGAPDIMAARLTAAGLRDPTWGGWVCKATGAQGNPVVISDGSGGGVIAWQDGRPGSGNDIYAQRLGQSGSIAPGWPVDGAPVCTSPGLQYGPRLVQDRTGGALIFWSDGNVSLTVVTEVRAQHLNGAGARVSNWPAEGLWCHAAPSGSILRGVVADGAGGATLAVEDAGVSGGLQFDVYVDHVTGLGVLSQIRVPACRDPHQQQQTALVSDGAGGAVLAWQDLRDTPTGSLDFTIYAQHVGAGDIAVDVPADRSLVTAFALEGARPNPSRGDLVVAFSLPDAAPATLELIDLSGRRLRVMAVGELGAGRRMVRFGAGARLKPGIYWIKLTWARRTLTSRAVVLP